MRSLADESCDFVVVAALRSAGHEVNTVADVNPGAEDDVVLAMARDDARVLLTEDKDFGQLAYAGGYLRVCSDSKYAFFLMACLHEAGRRMRN